MQNNAHILLVEDDASLGFVIKDNLEQEGMNVKLCVDGDDALKVYQEEEFHLCIIDIMLPKTDGFTVATKIREMNKDIPLIFLTAKSMKEDKIRGFKIGADDYIVKPFNIEELILRIRVFLKRSSTSIIKPKKEAAYEIGKYAFNYANLELSIDKHLKSLTQKEGTLLKVLYENKNQVVRRDTLLKEVWGTDDYFAGRSMDVFIAKLRKYLIEDETVKIVNHHGIGFKLTSE